MIYQYYHNNDVSSDNLLKINRAFYHKNRHGMSESKRVDTSVPIIKGLGIRKSTEGNLGIKLTATQIKETELEASVVTNRIKILKHLQEKAERSVEVARLKARKLKELNELKNLEAFQQQVLQNPKQKAEGMKRIMERAKSIGIRKKEPVALEPVFDNAIDAVKLRIEKQQQWQKIVESRRKLSLANEFKRNNVVEMEQAIKEHLREVEEKRMEKIKAAQFNYYQDVQRKLKEKHNRLRKLEEIEKSMMQKLSNTRSVENYEASIVKRSLSSIKPRQITDGYEENYKGVYLGRSESKPTSHFSINKPSKISGRHYFIH